MAPSQRGLDYGITRAATTVVLQTEHDVLLIGLVVFAVKIVVAAVLVAVLVAPLPPRLGGAVVARPTRRAGRRLVEVVEGLLQVRGHSLRDGRKRASL